MKLWAWSVIPVNGNGKEQRIIPTVSNWLHLRVFWVGENLLIGNFNLDYELQMSVQFNALGAYPYTSVDNLQEACAPKQSMFMNSSTIVNPLIFKEMQRRIVVSIRCCCSASELWKVARIYLRRKNAEQDSLWIYEKFRVNLFSCKRITKRSLWGYLIEGTSLRFEAT